MMTNTVQQDNCSPEQNQRHKVTRQNSSLTFHDPPSPTQMSSDNFDLNDRLRKEEARQRQGRQKLLSLAFVTGLVLIVIGLLCLPAESTRKKGALNKDVKKHTQENKPTATVNGRSVTKQQQDLTALDISNLTLRCRYDGTDAPYGGKPPTLFGNMETPTHLVVFTHGVDPKGALRKSGASDSLGRMILGGKKQKKKAPSSGRESAKASEIDDADGNADKAFSNILLMIPYAPSIPFTARNGSRHFAWFDMTVARRNFTSVEVMERDPDTGAVLSSARYIYSVAFNTALKYNISTQNIIFIGHSQGATVSIAVGLTAPFVPLGIIAVGSFLPGRSSIMSQSKASGRLNELANHQVPFIFFHGDDDPLISIDLARLIENDLKEYNGGIPEGEHRIPTRFVTFKALAHGFGRKDTVEAMSLELKALFRRERK